MRLVFVYAVLLCSQALVGEVSGNPTLEVPEAPVIRPVTPSGATSANTLTRQMSSSSESSAVMDLAKLNEATKPQPEIVHTPGKPQSPVNGQSSSASATGEDLKSKPKPTVNTNLKPNEEDTLFTQSPDSFTESSPIQQDLPPLGEPKEVPPLNKPIPAQQVAFGQSGVHPEPQVAIKEPNPHASTQGQSFDTQKSSQEENTQTLPSEDNQLPKDNNLRSNSDSSTFSEEPEHLDPNPDPSTSKWSALREKVQTGKVKVMNARIKNTEAMKVKIKDTKTFFKELIAARPTPKQFFRGVAASSKAMLSRITPRKIASASVWFGLGAIFTVGVLGGAGAFDKSGPPALSQDASPNNGTSSST